MTYTVIKHTALVIELLSALFSEKGIRRRRRISNDLNSSDRGSRPINRETSNVIHNIESSDDEPRLE